MPIRSRALIFAAAIGLFALSFSSVLQARKLDIAPAQQDTHVWCWLAVSEMALRYFGVPDVNPNSYQCGMAGLLFSDTPCRNFCQACTFPAGNARNLVSAIERYPEFLRIRANRYSPRVMASYKDGNLSPREVVSRINAGQPIIAGISPSGRPNFFASEHVALIIGYEDGGNRLIVNDPYPFPPGLWSNPYLAAGAEQADDSTLQYTIDHSDFVSRLSWRESIIVSGETERRGLVRQAAETVHSPTSTASVCTLASSFAAQGASYLNNIRGSRIEDSSFRVSRGLANHSCTLDITSEGTKRSYHFSCQRNFSDFKTAKSALESLEASIRDCMHNTVWETGDLAWDYDTLGSVRRNSAAEVHYYMKRDKINKTRASIDASLTYRYNSARFEVEFQLIYDQD